MDSALDLNTSPRGSFPYIMGDFKHLIAILSFRGARFFSYFFLTAAEASESAGDTFLKLLARASPLLMAKLIPSEELGLMSPAASPQRKTLSLPVRMLPNI